jgi:hypothetical protein
VGVAFALNQLPCLGGPRVHANRFAVALGDLCTHGPGEDALQLVMVSSMLLNVRWLFHTACPALQHAPRGLIIAAHGEFEGVSARYTWQPGRGPAVTDTGLMPRPMVTPY